MKRNITFTKRIATKDLPSLVGSIQDIDGVSCVTSSMEFYIDMKGWGPFKRRIETSSLSVHGEFNPSDVYSLICRSGYTIIGIDDIDLTDLEKLKEQEEKRIPYTLIRKWNNRRKKKQEQEGGQE